MSKSSLQAGVVTLPAAIDLSSARGYACSVAAGKSINLTNAATLPFGVILIPTKEGEDVSVALFGSGQVVPVKLAVSASIGDYLVINADGRFAVFDTPIDHTGQLIAAIVLEEGAENDIIAAQLLTPVKVP